jgi:KDO2-lipid IV(A) lauroyltransferase
VFDRAEPHEYVAAWGARLALGLFRLLPLDAASALGGWLGRRLGPHLPVSRHAARNLERAMPDLAADRQRAVLTGMWDNLGRVLAEYAHLPDIGRAIELKDDRVTITGLQHIEAIRNAGKPVIFFSAHYGNWELLGLTATRYGLPLVQVYRAANNPLTEELLQDLRQAVGGRLVPKGMQAAREMLKALKQNESLAMLIDQKLSTGIAVPFFGHDAMTAPAIAELALRADCPVVPAYVERLQGARFRVVVEAPLQLEKTGDRERDIFTGMQLLNGRIETWIRARPEQWFWVHKRWKT